MNRVAQANHGGDRPTRASRFPCPQCGEQSTGRLGMGLATCDRCLFNLALEPINHDLHSDPCSSSKMPLNPTLLGFYVLMEEIGRGGQGVIYLAKHRETGEVVAVKTVLPQDLECPETRARFQREAETAQQLAHPNSMPILEIGGPGERVPFFAMKLAVGGSLHQLGAKYRGRWRQIAELLVKISEAVHHAHERKILHRDLKPGNILFTEDHEPLVTDFGLAKQLASSDGLTQSCSVLGTPSYISPEQAAGQIRDLTPASDIYSLGAILFDLLTGRPPFVGDNPLDVLQQVANRRPRKPRNLVPSIPPALESICMRCLARRREDRYQSAHELAADLKNWLEGREITLQPAYVRLWREMRIRSVAWTWWCAAVGSGATLWLSWILWVGNVPRSTVVGTIAVAIDDLDQNPFLSEVAQKTTLELRRKFTRSALFHLAAGNLSEPSHSAGIIDPLAYGRAQGARVVLTGCVRRSGQKIRLVTRLLRCDSEEVIWRRVDNLSIDGALPSLPIVANKIFDDVVVRWQASPQLFGVATSYVPSPDAQAFFIKAKELAARTNENDLRDAVACFRRAVEIDPHFVGARAMLGFALWAQADRYGDLDKISLAVSAAREALAIDPSCAQAHRVLGSCYFKTACYDKAIEEFWIALELNPHSAGNCQSLGVCLREMGHPYQAVVWLKRAVQLDRAHGVLSAALGESLALCARYSEAEATLVHAIELDENKPDIPVMLCGLRTWQKDYGAARRLCMQARLRFPENRFGLSLAAWIEFCDGRTSEAAGYFEELRSKKSYLRTWEFYGAVNPSSALAYLAKTTGGSARAQSLAQEALRMDDELLHSFPHNARILHDMAATYCLLGDTHRSLTLLEEAFAAGWAEKRSTEIDPRFVSIADDPRFKRIVASTLPDID